MTDITFDQLLEATRSLMPHQRQVLAQMLHLISAAPEVDALTEADVLSEAGAFSVFTPLHDEHPHTTTISDAELVAAAQCISCEWEEEPF
jgi:hypothetical protein